MSRGKEIQAPQGDWAALSARLTEAVHMGGKAGLAGHRKDVIVKIGPGITEHVKPGLKAMFDMREATVHIDGRMLTDGKGNPIDPRDCHPEWPGQRERYGALMGLLVHEISGHAGHSIWMDGYKPAPEDAAAAKAAVLLEEVRAECAAADRRAQDIRWLRQSAARHLADELRKQAADPSAPADPRSIAATIGTLVGGRIAAGILCDEEVLDLLQVAVRAAALAGKPTMAADVRAIAEEALDIADDDRAGMMALGRRWVAAVGTPPAEQDPDTTSADDMSSAADGEGSEGEGDGDQDQQQDGTSGQPEDQEQAEGNANGTPTARELLEEAAKAAERMDHNIVRAHGHKPMRGWTPPNVGADVRWVKITPEERRAAGLLARKMTDYIMPERAATRVATTLPPGRLSGRQLLQQEGQRTAGQSITATPWRGVHRRQVQTPPLRVGIMVDTSGSMQQYERYVNALACRLSLAFAALPDCVIRMVRTGGTSDGRAEPWPVREGQIGALRFGSYGNENLDDAMERLTERLNLTARNAARLIILIGDGAWDYCNEGTVRAKQLMATGARVIWITPVKLPDYWRSREIADHPNCQVITLNPGTVGSVKRDTDEVVAEVEAALTALMRQGFGQ